MGRGNFAGGKVGPFGTATAQSKIEARHLSLPIPSNLHLQANARWFAALTAWPINGHDKDNRVNLSRCHISCHGCHGRHGVMVDTVVIEDH